MGPSLPLPDTELVIRSHRFCRNSYSLRVFFLAQPTRFPASPPPARQSLFAMSHSRTDYKSGDEHHGPGRDNSKKNAEQTRRSAHVSSDKKRPDHQHEA